MGAALCTLAAPAQENLPQRQEARNPETQEATAAEQTQQQEQTSREQQEQISQEGAKIWSLGDCIDYALQSNIPLQQSRINVENMEIALNTTQMSRLPGISASASESYNIGRAQNREGIYEDRGSANTSMGVSASVTIFQGMRINRQAQADRLSLEAATLDLEQARSDLSLQVTAAYLQVLYAKEAEKMASEQVGISRMLVEKTEKMVDGGTKSVSELYDAQSALASAESSYVDAVNARQTAVLDLVQTMNYRDCADFDISVPEYGGEFENAVLSLTPADSIYNGYIGTRPSVMAAQKRVEQAQKQVKVAQSGYYPAISAGASYNTGYYSAQAIASGNSSFWHQLSQNGTPSVGVSLNIPIFNRMSTYNSVRSAKNAVRMQQLSLEKEKQSVFKEVQQAYVNAKAAYGQYIAGRKSLEAARKAFEFEQMKYEAGRSTAYQFNEQRIKYADAEARLSQARYSFILRVKILDFYKGEPLY